MPTMNHSFAREGRQAGPGQARARQPGPGHRPGEAQRRPPARRRRHQEGRDAELLRVLAGVRGHRPPGPHRQADDGRLQRRHRVADQPRRPGHRALRAAADARPVDDPRRRLDGLPGRVPGHLAGHPEQAGHLQGHDADQHLRPPGDPGRRLRRVPADHEPAAARRERLLRRHLRGAAHPVRAGPLAHRHRHRARGRRHQGRAGLRADPLLPGPRPRHGRHRPAGVPPAQAPRPGRPGARADPVGPGARVRRRRLRGQVPDEAARHPRRAARLVLPHRRHRVHAHPGPQAAQVDPGPDRAAARQARARGAAAHPAAAQRGRGVRDVPADQVRRPEAVLARGRRVGHPAARRGDRRGGRVAAGRGRHRHGAPRPAERAGQHRRQVLRPDLPRVRGQPRPEVDARLRRREVPPGRRGHLHRAGRRADQGLAGREPLAPGGGRPGPRGHRPRQAGRDQQGRHRLHRAADRAARRRGLRRPGRGGRDAEHVAAARLPHRRHRARGDQQPGRLHRRPGVGPLLDVQHRRGPDDRGADLPCQRRRPGGRGPRGAAGLRVPAGVQQGRRDRPDLLPPPRPQRVRQPRLHPAADVRPDRQEALGAQALHRVADRPRRHHPGGGRAGAPGLPGAVGEGLHRGPRGRPPPPPAGSRPPTSRSSRSRCRPRSPARWSSGSPSRR